MKERGIQDLDSIKVVGDWSAASGELGLRQLLSMSPQVDSIFASNDQMALGALRAARDLGIMIPGDLGIVGFDDIPEAAYFYPSLSTIQQNAESLGAVAVDQMCNMIRALKRGEAYETEIVWVKPKLVVRDSSTR